MSASASGTPLSQQAFGVQAVTPSAVKPVAVVMTRFRPSSLNCTPATATLSLALAETATVAEMVAPPAGAVMETDGGVVSLDTVTAMPAEVVTLPAASRATAVSVWLPLVAPVVFQDTEYGEA